MPHKYLCSVRFYPRLIVFVKFIEKFFYFFSWVGVLQNEKFQQLWESVNKMKVTLFQIQL